MTLAEAVLAAMISLQPPGASVYSRVVVEGPGPAPCVQVSIICSAPWLGADKRWRRYEQPDEGLERYRTIAEAIADSTTAACSDGRWPGTCGELWRYLVAVTRYESGWARDVHEGAPWATRLGWCLGQINLGRTGRTPRGYLGRELVGVDPEHTLRCTDTITEYLVTARARCKGDHAPCVFAGYAGLPRVDSHPGIGQRACVYWWLSRRAGE